MQSSNSWHYYLRKKNRDNQKVPLSSSLCLLLARFPRRTHVTCGPRGLACFALRGSGRGRKIFSDLADWIAMSLSIHLLPPFFYPFFSKDYLLYSKKCFLAGLEQTVTVLELLLHLVDIITYYLRCTSTSFFSAAPGQVQDLRLRSIVVLVEDR